MLCAPFLVLGLIQADRDAVTVDEAVDLAAGLVAIDRHDLRMNPEHALLHHALPGILPVLVADPILPDTEAYDDGDWFDYTDDVVRANDEAGRLERVVFWFRIVPLAIGAVTGLLIYALGARLVNRIGGLVAAGLWLTTPYVLGIAHLSSLDVSFTCAVVAVALLFDRWREDRTDGRALALAAMVGGALLVRHTALVLVPVVGISVLVTARGADRRALLRQIGLLVVVPVAVVWLGYRLVDPTPVDGPPRDRFEALVDQAADAGPVQAAVLAVPMPIEWRAGFAHLAETSEGRPAYLLGESWTGSRSWFFPASAAVKLPLTASVGLLLGLGGWAFVGRGQRRRAAWVLAPPALTLLAFLVAQPLDLGLRLALPVLGLGFVAVASLGRLEFRPLVIVAVVLAIGQAGASVLGHPDSLAWTPPPFSDGYRAVSDGNIELGQANSALRDRHRNNPFVAVSATAPRGYDAVAGVPTVESADASALVGDVAVGATQLTVTHRDELSWLRAYCPVDVLAGAVLVYRFDAPPDTAPGPDTPAAPCAGSVSRRG